MFSMNLVVIIIVSVEIVHKKVFQTEIGLYCMREFKGLEFCYTTKT